MKTNLKFTFPRLALGRVLRFPPQRYWEKFLFALLVLFITVLAFDIWVFRRFAFRLPPADGGSSPTVSAAREPLERAYARAKERNAIFHQNGREAGIKDPAR